MSQTLLPHVAHRHKRYSFLKPYCHYINVSRPTCDVQTKRAKGILKLTKATYPVYCFHLVFYALRKSSPTFLRDLLRLGLLLVFISSHTSPPSLTPRFSSLFPPAVPRPLVRPVGLNKPDKRWKIERKNYKELENEGWENESGSTPPHSHCGKQLPEAPVPH